MNHRRTTRWATAFLAIALTGALATGAAADEGAPSPAAEPKTSLEARLWKLLGSDPQLSDSFCKRCHACPF